MENPIKDNRIVCDYTFAKRLHSLVSSLQASDPSSFEEKEAFLNYSKRLLRHQCTTATNQDEIDYLKRIGVYEQMTEPLLTTYDGAKIYENETRQRLYSCMAEPTTGEQLLTLSISRKEDLINRNKGRIYFLNETSCKDYIRDNRPSLSRKDLKDAGLLGAFEAYKGNVLCR